MGTHYSHVTQADRISIQALMQAKHNGPEIARQLGLSRSTINREINRGKASPTAPACDYQAGIAQARSGEQHRAGGVSRRKLGSGLVSPLWRTVLSGLRCRVAPADRRQTALHEQGGDPGWTSVAGKADVGIALDDLGVAISGGINLLTQRGQARMVARLADPVDGH